MSRFEQHRQRKEIELQERLNLIKQTYDELTESNLSKEEKLVDVLCVQFENERDLSKTIVHVDMDELDNTLLRDKPMAVGDHSMLCTANYKARQFGVKSAMPGYVGKQKCPELIIVPTRFDRYKEMSAKVQIVFRNYDPNFAMASLDEAYLDLTLFLQKINCEVSPEDIVAKMRKEIYESTGLTASAGIGPTTTIAKISSDINKPNGQFSVPNDIQSVMEFIRGTAVKRVPGIGQVTQKTLNVLGIEKCIHLYEKRVYLYKLFTPLLFEFLLRTALGIGCTYVEKDDGRKSISVERTFADLNDSNLLFDKIREISESLASDMKKEGLCCKTVTLKIKKSTFEVLSRSKTLHRFVDKASDFYQIAKQLMEKELPIEVRLLGLRASHLHAVKDVDVLKNFWKQEGTKCPICNRFLDEENNDKVNNHIDECLNRKEVKRLSLVDTSSVPKRKKIEPKKRESIVQPSAINYFKK